MSALFSSGPETEKKRRLTETDVDPSGDLGSGPGDTEDAGAGRRRDNQPAENRENATRSEGSGNNARQDSENAPKAGEEE
jgi:hypothetical protein